MVQSRELLDTIVKENKGEDSSTVVGLNVAPVPEFTDLLLIFPPVVYGITTGFGKFARTVIPISKLK